MKQFHEFLNSRKQELQHFKETAESALKHAPNGFLRINRRGKRVQYYHRTDPKDTSGTYICQGNLEFARELAQKDYNTKFLHSVERELLAIERYYATLPPKPMEEIYSSLNEERQRLVTPYIESAQQYIDRWISVQYQGKAFNDGAPELYTSKGERVRSKSEIIIADALARECIPYRYEYPVTLSSYGNIYPDFTILNIRLRKEWYWEHLGMMDDPMYAEQAIKKITTYASHNIFPGENLILTYETKQIPLNPKIIHLLIQKYLL